MRSLALALSAIIAAAFLTAGAVAFSDPIEIVGNDQGSITSVPDPEPSAVTLTYLYDLFARVGNAQLCARGAYDHITPVPDGQVWFSGSNLFGAFRATGAATTDANGVACLPNTWPSDVYEVVALGLPGSPLENVVSEPVAVTLWVPGWPGVMAGGAIFPGPPLGGRRATFGVAKIAGLNGEKLLYLDPQRAEGPVKIMCTKFDRVTEGYKSWTFYGWCTYIEGRSAPVPRKFFAFVGLVPSGQLYFTINVLTNQGNWVYYARGEVVDGGVRRGF